MAFGSWFKNIVSKTKNAIRKALPIVRKIIDTTKTIAPILSPVIGGNAGKLINNIGNYAGKIDNGLNRIAPQNLKLSRIQNNNITPDRFAIPMLK